MAALDLTSRVAVLSHLTDQLPSEDESVLEALLDASAANDCGTPPTATYRPWWVLANVLASNPSTFESVRSAAGSQVQYRDPAGAVSALMQRQAALDQGLCNVPAGFEAVAPGGPGSRSVVRAYG